jgi:hypothetical protein
MAAAADAIYQMLDGKPIFVALGALLLVADRTLDEVLKSHPPIPIAKVFHEMQGHIEEHVKVLTGLERRPRA